MKRKFMKPRTKSVKTDKIHIPHPLHWPMDLREGIDLDEIYEFIKIPQEWLDLKFPRHGFVDSLLELLETEALLRKGCSQPF